MRAGRLWIGYLLGMALLLPLYLLLSTERFDTPARLLAWLGLGLSILPLVVMLERKDARPCSVAAVGLTIALFYHLAPFHERVLLLRWGEARLSVSSVTLGQLLSALATPALWAGWALLGLLRVSHALPQPRLDVAALPLRIAGTVIVLLSMLTDLLWLRGALTTYQPAVSVISVLTPSELGFAMVLLPSLQQPADGQKHDRRGELWFWLLAATALGLSLMRGMIMPLMKPLLVYLLGFFYVRRRVLLWPLMVALFAVLVLQPVKGEFRARMWDRKSDTGLLDRAALYLDLVSRHWFASDVDRDVDKEQSVRTAAARVGGALALANVVELTPQAVPFQWGATYRYLRYAPVPRVFYPDKPIAQYADVWAAVVYGYTTKRGTEHVMIGLSQIAEAYINFGFPLCFVMLMFIGGLLRIMDELFAHPRAGSGALAIHLFFLQSMIFTAEGSLANFWGGVLQQFLLYTLGMLVLGGLSRRSAPSRLTS
jgi:hypothetical protein